MPFGAAASGARFTQRQAKEEKLKIVDAQAGWNADDFKCVGVHPENSLGLTPGDFIHMPGHGDFVLTVKFAKDVGADEIATTDLQRANFHVVTGEYYTFAKFELGTDSSGDTASAPVLSAIAVECWLLQPSKQHQEVVIDGKKLFSVLVKALCTHVVSVGEKFVAPTVVLEVKGRSSDDSESSSESEGEGEDGDGQTSKRLSPGSPVDMVVMVTDVRGDQHEEADESALYNYIHQGTADPQTTIFFRGDLRSDVDRRWTAKTTVGNYSQPQTWESGSTSHMIDVYTSDGEWFPVPRKLLTPCISLTQSLRDKSGGSTQVKVEVECLLFDKILLYLEAEATGAVEEYDDEFDINLTEEFLAAARHLGCRGLEELCLRKMGDFESRVREYSWEEVVERTKDQEEYLIVIDGMVIDVTRWLPQHPGGPTIIPKQALGVDATVFFEIYHSSRESFQYLKQLYIGEIKASDLNLIPPSRTTPSIEFLDQLRRFTKFRLNAKTITSF